VMEANHGEPDLLQLRYRGEPWKLLVCCILLNRTRRSQGVDRVAEELFRRWPTPRTLADAPHLPLVRLLTPLGFQRRRALSLRRFAEDWTWLGALYQGTTPAASTELRAMHGVGDYAFDAYRLLVLGDLSVPPRDKELLRWWRWRMTSLSKGDPREAGMVRGYV